MKEAGFDRGLKILFLCFFVFVIVALIVWTALPSEWMKGPFVIFVAIFIYLFIFIGWAYIKYIGYFKIFGQIIEIGGCKIKDWKENWRLFFVVLTVGVLCFFALLLLEHHMVIEWIRIWWPYYFVCWIYLQGYWALKKYRSGKFKKAIRLLCQAKYENDGTFYSCLKEQAWLCKRIIGCTGSVYGGRSGSEHITPIYESHEETEGRLEACVEVNYDGWLKKYKESSQEEKEKR